MTRSSMLRENDVIVYLIKDRWLDSVTSFDQCKQRHLHMNAVKFGRNLHIFINISFENGFRKLKLLNY